MDMITWETLRIFCISVLNKQKIAKWQSLTNQLAHCHLNYNILM
ncbi:hypothetical protein T06_4525 [Trichinella sp. T6]|nr:hypothetical protein T06_4525 [Trichinella sp. T6]